jgi:hypothetical protein
MIHLKGTLYFMVSLYQQIAWHSELLKFKEKFRYFV